MNGSPARLRVFVIGALLPLLAIPARAQEPTAKDDLLRRIYLADEFAVESLGPTRWVNGGDAYTTLEPSVGVKDASDLVRYETASGRREVLVSASDMIPPGSTKPLAIEDYAWSKEMGRLLVYTNSQRVWRKNTRGDYWVLDRGTKKLRKLGGEAAPATLQFAKFSPDGTKLAYLRANNIYVEDAATGAITQLTHDGSETIINGTSDWVYEEELDIRDAFRWSPDGKRIAYWQFNTSTERTFQLIYNLGAPDDVVTQIPSPKTGIYPVVKSYPYPQPGTLNALVRVGVVPATGGETRWMQVTGDPEKSYIAGMGWAGSSDSLVIQHLNRRQNENDVVLADANTGAATVVRPELDDTWVDTMPEEIPWVHGGKDFLWLSEQDGWRHAYVISRDGKTTKLATRGEFDVIRLLGVDPQEQWIYYIASPDNATQRYLYRSRIDGSGAAERVSQANQPGTHDYAISPDFRWAFHTYSTFNTPPVIALEGLADRHAERTLRDNAGLREKVKGLHAQPGQFLKVDIGGGVVLDAWMIKPGNFDGTKKYPVLVYVYGGPSEQTVLDSWDENEDFLFFAQQGYVVVSVDNRGTPSPRGRTWRKAEYGTQYVLAAKEQAAALQELERTYSFLDASRVAVWGWSAGGSNTLHLMFRWPDLYKVGMSIASLADVRLYDTIYKERYLGLPKENPSGYRASSAINYAEGLRGNLLIVQGSADDNNHYQNAELLINRLVELGKSFDMMEYPGRTHSISEGSGTKYHLFSLLTRYLEEHLPPGPAPH